VEPGNQLNWVTVTVSAPGLEVPPGPARRARHRRRSRFIHKFATATNGLKSVLPIVLVVKGIHSRAISGIHEPAAGDEGDLAPPVNGRGVISRLTEAQPHLLIAACNGGLSRADSAQVSLTGHL